MCFAPQRRTLFSTSEPPKMVRNPSVLYILTSKCASRHNGVHFFDIWTSKSGPRMVCFVHFDFEMCFAPQPRALFRHRNFQKWSGPGVFCISLCLSIYLSMYLSISPCIDLCIYRSIYLSVCLSIDLSVFLSVYLSSHLSIYLIYPAGPSLSLFHLITYLSIYLPVYLPLPFISLSV